MKMTTHILFSIFVLLLFQIKMGVDYPIQIIFLSLINFVIDGFGHSGSRGLHRIPLTHSLPSGVIIGAVGGLGEFYAFRFLGGPVPLWFSITGGVLVGLSHLLLDMMTFNGIYIVRRRFAIAHFKNGLIDIPFAVTSIAFILYFLWPHLIL
ncbi:MAG: DUF1286 domain-containing protein [Thermoplasmatales archaeon]